MARNAIEFWERQTHIPLTMADAAIIRAFAEVVMHEELKPSGEEDKSAQNIDVLTRFCHFQFGCTYELIAQFIEADVVDAGLKFMGNAPRDNLPTVRYIKHLRHERELLWGLMYEK